MRIAEADCTIELKSKEIDAIAYALYYNLKHSIESHYNTLQQDVDGEPVFYEQEKINIYLMKEMFGLVGCRELCESFIREFTRLFEEKRKERENK